MAQSMTYRVARYCVDVGRFVTSSELAEVLGTRNSHVRAAMRRIERLGGEIQTVDRKIALKILFIPEMISDDRWVKEVIAINGNGQTIEFSSIRETERSGFTKSSVMQAIERGSTYAGYKWRLAGEVKWSKSDIATLYRGEEPKGKTSIEIADMRARLGIRLPNYIMKRRQIMDDIMSCRITIDWAAEKYDTTPRKICQLMGWE